MLLSQCPTRLYPEDAWDSFVLLFLFDFLVLIYFVLQAFVHICAASAVVDHRLILSFGVLAV